MKIKNYLTGIFCVALLLGADQITKYFAYSVLRKKQEIPLLSDIFVLQYLENHGAAFGILQDKRWLLLGITFLVLIVLGIIYGKIPPKKRFRWMKFVITLLTAGAIGNMIDRLFRGYVIDFLYFKWIHFPIFNVADCYVVIAVFLAFFLLCFYYKEEDFDFLRKKTNAKAS